MDTFNKNKLEVEEKIFKLIYNFEKNNKVKVNTINLNRLFCVNGFSPIISCKINTE